MAHGLSSVMSGMDNVRNITGSPIAGIDPHELINVRQLCHGEGPLPGSALHCSCALIVPGTNMQQ